MKSTLWVMLWIAVAAVATAGLWPRGETREAEQAPPSHLMRVLEAQSDLPPESVVALQDLRLMAAVQMAHYSAKGGFESPQNLKELEYLDPQWPRVDPEAYTVACELNQDGAAFICYADPVKAGMDWYMADSTQAVRWSADARPTPRSAVFGLDDKEK